MAAQHIAEKHQGEEIPSQEETRASFIASAVMV